MDEDKKLVSIGEASDYLGVSIDTLRRWEKKGKLPAYRSPGGHRYFKLTDLDKVFGKKYKRESSSKRKGSLQEKNKEDNKEKFEEKRVSEKILDRPVRPVEIPQRQTVRVIREQVIASTSQSILIPSTQKEKEYHQKPPAGIKTQDKRPYVAWIVIGAILIVALSLGIALFLYWQSSQVILTPIP